MFAKIASDKIFRKLDKLEWGRLTLLTPDGKTRVFEGNKTGENVTLELRDWRALTNLVLKGDIGFAEDYRAGHWETDNLKALTVLGLNNKSALDGVIAGNGAWRLLAMLSYQIFKRNTIKGSKKNIHAHYDIGNTFYKLWLDPSMTYSSAVFKSSADDLHAGQMQKYDRILDCLDTKSGSILEIGCGWGGFAERAQDMGDFSIKGLTLSDKQRIIASERLGSKADITLQDYRHENGKFNNIVSIEMFEAVGEQYWGAYFSKLKSLLARDGKAVIQTITMNETGYERYRMGGDFIRSFIFPGGMLPSVSRFEKESFKAGLKAHTPFFFGQDYARTLSIWLDNFDAKLTEIKALGFDDGFIRLWRLYLAGCIAGFKTGRTNVMQMELTHV